MVNDELGDFMRRTIAEHNMPQDTWFVFRSLEGSVVPKEFCVYAIKDYISKNPKGAMFMARMAMVPIDSVWITTLAMETVEELRYIPDHELH